MNILTPYGCYEIIEVRDTSDTRVVFGKSERYPGYVALDVGNNIPYLPDNDESRAALAELEAARMRLIEMGRQWVWSLPSGVKK